MNLDSLPLEIIMNFQPLLDEIEKNNVILTKEEFINKSKEIYKVSSHFLI